MTAALSQRYLLKKLNLLPGDKKSFLQEILHLTICKIYGIIYKNAKEYAMDKYKYSGKGNSSIQTSSVQTKSTPAIGRSGSRCSAVQKKNMGSLNLGASGEKRVVFDNKLSADGLSNNGAWGFKLSGTRARFSSWTPEQRNAHAFTRDINAPSDAHISDNFPSVRDNGAKFKKNTSDIIQREQLTDTVTDVDPAIPPLAPNPKPTIVFETMTQKSDDALSIFNQSQQYSGNTICIVGLNQQVNDFNANTKNQMSAKKFAVEDNSVPGKNKSVHILKCFRFNWKKPSQVTPNAQYKMPFVEARLEVMKQAQKLTNDLEKEAADDYSHKFIYRWIDGDAADDTSEEIPDFTLQKLGNNELKAVSGIYGWRSSVDSKQYPAYTQFIHEINCFEELVRRIYFEYKGSLEGLSNENQHLPEFLPGGNINGYYFPETTLMLSNGAHNSMIAKVSEKIPEGRNQFLRGAEQSKESMRMLSISEMPRGGGQIIHSDALRVTKPLKNEFNTATDGTPCYLGKDFLNALKDGTPMTRDKFKQNLKQMRQSVLGMFNTVENRDAYNERVERLVTGLYDYYNDHCKVISSELNAILGAQQPAAQRGQKR